ncbi:helicase RepA family protein [Ruminococcaceae bacterium OttesenSCG-928-N02]|nr:helicase RepA family protein [Ruminococcaceae bacterium OttesenSCG-928-N02]
MENETKTIIKALDTIDGNTLMAQEFEPLRFAVDKILPYGLFILAGSPKVGKSWLSLDLCQAVATGSQLWDYQANQGDVLYFALEDNYSRLQTRLQLMDTETQDISALYLATASFGLSDGLLEQIHGFVAEHPDTKLIVIDTLEHIRNGEFDKNMYACDYRDMNKLREITSKYKLSLVLVHHTRKMYDPDPLNTISGSTGLVGAVDGVFVLEKSKRTSNEGKLTIANRDTENYCFALKFNPDVCRWGIVSKDGDGDNEVSICIIIDDFLKDTWRGTATELCNALLAQNTGDDLTPLSVKQQLKRSSEQLKSKYGITVSFERSRDNRFITLARDD